MSCVTLFLFGFGQIVDQVKSDQISPVRFPLYAVVSRQWQFYICR